MPTTGAIRESSVMSMGPVNIIQATRQPPTGNTTTSTNLPDDREIFKVLHDCMKDVAKFRQYIYYLGTSCDTTKLRNKVQKLKERINCGFFHQREVLGHGVSATGSVKSELAVRRFEKFLCFTLASLSYYEDLLHKFSILLVYFPVATGDRENVVNLGFEDSTITADEVSYENHEMEENETNRYIELLNQIQSIQALRDDIEHIDIYQLRHHATSYSKEFVENMHKYTTDLITERNLNRNHSNNFRHYSSDETSLAILRCHRRCHRRKFVCILSIALSILLIVGFTIVVLLAMSKTSNG
ncbi:unnamed protein product [Adineta steineri]|uniref:Uncharacterized protein n=1 Tax=Adineta steineri TaxID=433720 RepID=A0A814MS34_9BILA|nr:unnamed protein product [Adineta steineri]CAF1127562.1 unnamed protein product [Adineta steineri]CAF3507964.1 unnamed protein product [Adineta steineri]CAF3803129.1 unnamed protein product [Adineta steineri]